MSDSSAAQSPETPAEVAPAAREATEAQPEAFAADPPQGPMRHADRWTMRRALRREVAATVGLLTDEHDFRAMRAYRSFAFADYSAYMQAVEDLLSTRGDQGAHTMLALFDPAEYADFCTESGIDPDNASSRSRYTAQLPATSPTVHYDGQPLSDLIPALVEEGVRRATWEYASALLARLGSCGTCGKDLGHEAFARAQVLLSRILDTADPGNRHLVCSVSATPEPLAASLHADTDADGAAQLDDAEALEFTTLLALGLAARPGGLIMRSHAPNTPHRVYGWRLHAGEPEPLTAAEVFDAYCTDSESGGPIPPELGVAYGVPPDLGPDSAASAHRH